MSNRLDNIKEIKKDHITVEFFYNETKDRFKLQKITSSEIGSEKVISEKDTNRPGLALTGYFDLFSYKRIQVLGNTEMKYLSELPAERRHEILTKFFSYQIPCIIITDANEVAEEFKKFAEDNNVPIFKTHYPTTRLAYFISDFLDDQFSTQVVLHGSFVDVYGIGVLFMGKSGIGKSEIALDLIERGHRLVADDIVVVSKKGENVLMGSGTALVKHFMEIRGLGIIDVKSIFGIRSIRFQKRVEVIVELEHWDPSKAYERTGLDSKTVHIMGVETELITLPIFPGKNITVIAEVIALNYLCKHYGFNAAEEFEKKLSEKIKQNETEKPKKEPSKYDRTIEYFEHDFE